MNGRAAPADPVATRSAWLPRPTALASGLTGVLTALAVALTFTADVPYRRFHPGWGWAFALSIAGFFATERTVFHVEYRRESVSFSLSEVPLAFALVFLPPGTAIVARLLGSLTAIVLARRPTAVKLAFNAALFAAETAVAAALVHRLTALGDGQGAALLGSLVVAIAVGTGLGGVMVALAVTCFEGGLRRRLAGELRTGSVVYLLGAVAGAVSVAPALVDWRLCLLPVVPVLSLWRLLLSRGVLAQQYRDLEDLHAFTGRVGHSLDLDRMTGDACEEVRRLLRAESASLVLFDDQSGRVVASASEGAAIPLPSTPGDLRWTSLLRSPGIHTVTADAPNPLGRWLTQSGRLDALVAPIADDLGLLGLLVLADRAGAHDQFSDDDRKRLAPLVDQLAVSLRKGLLHRQVEREASHDRLTGLPTRALLEAELEGALRDTVAVGVLMLDIDRFKEINDTLGHHTGDAVLCEFARRITDVLGSRGLLARFAGDEFAVVARSSNRDDNARLAQEILDELRRPFDVGELTIAVACSIGATCGPADGAEGADLLRRADLAMYDAKGRSSGFEPYRPAMDVNSADRLAMLAELRVALETDQIEVFFQPKVDLARNVVVGAEALVRWQHPRHGLLAADRFIGLAERTDLIHRLSEIVLSQSLRAVRHWRDAGLDLGVAVNYSARSLFDELLADRIAHQLELHGVPAELLTIEVTESSVMSDVTRAATILERLRALGISISVDDYGTGYSSLAYLRRLPVTELKIDRAFVTNLLIEPDDEIIVRSTIELARNLGLQVVAEGVEATPVAAKLRELGCHLGQGYGFSRPLPLVKFDAWLTVADHRPVMLA